MTGRARWLAAGTLLLLAAAAAPANAQRPQRRGLPRPTSDPKVFSEFNVPYDGHFTFVRLRYTPSRTGYGGGGGFFGGINYQWDHDYPRADEHFSKILAELTNIGVHPTGYNILSIGDPELFEYPVAYLVEAGWWTLSDAEVLNLRTYLQKGGFLIFDDFAGPAMGEFAGGIRRILPGSRLIRLTADHPIFHAFFDVDTLNFHHPYYGMESVFYGVFEDNDPSKRLLLIANYNNDIGESWEWSDTGFFPIEINNTAFKLGVNYIVYSMTH